MNLYIETEDGVTKNHPAYEDNLIQAFGSVPAQWKPFVRVAPPAVGMFEVCDECVYKFVDGVWTDVHQVRAMTAEERTVVEARNAALALPAMPTTGGPWKFDQIQKEWVIMTEPPYPSWTLSEDGLRYLPPIPRPREGNNKYRWDEATLSWVAFNV